LAKRITAVIWLILAILTPLAGDQALREEIMRLDLQFRWDPYLETGTLYRGNRSLAFALEGSFIVLDNRIIESGTVYRNDEGALFADESFISALRKRFPEADPSSLSVSTVIIDAGHGGKDPGAVGRHTGENGQLILYEKDIVLAVASDLHRRLSTEYPEKQIILTRSDDTYLTLEERTEIANAVSLRDNEAMVFISIHANASLNTGATGFEVWYLPPDYRRELIDPESIDPDMRDVAPILNTMLEEEFTVESILLARSVSAGLEASIGSESDNRGLKEESWFVVRNAKMPSVLVELGFVTNPLEAALLSEPSYLKKLSEGIYNGVTGFIGRFSE
jgi:N-acetylmuramoyl-L-alanine amidase